MGESNISGIQGFDTMILNYNGFYIPQEIPPLNTLELLLIPQYTKHQDVESSQQPTNIAQKPCNRSKNRSQSILPYDNNLVSLSNGNYINASWIRDSKGVNRYIATQAPMNNTVIDFWQMCFEQNVSVIVMLSEFGRGSGWEEWMGTENLENWENWENWMELCADYCTGPTQVHEPFLITTINTEIHDTGTYTTRHITILNQETNVVHKIIHFQYHNWGLHRCPVKSDFMKFHEHVRSVYQELPNIDNSIPPTAPMVVHCSAGVYRKEYGKESYGIISYGKEYGSAIEYPHRTGVFIMFDLLISQSFEFEFKNGKMVLRQLRMQRQRILDNYVQYMFVYDALLEKGMSLLNQKNETNSLQTMCRSIILQHVPLNQVSLLPLPKKMLEFLSYDKPLDY